MDWSDSYWIIRVAGNYLFGIMKQMEHLMYLSIKFQFLAGFISFLCPVLPNKQREKYVPVHVFFGLAGFVLAISAALLGLCEKQITTL